MFLSRILRPPDGRMCPSTGVLASTNPVFDDPQQMSIRCVIDVFAGWRDQPIHQKPDKGESRCV